MKRILSISFDILIIICLCGALHTAFILKDRYTEFHLGRLDTLCLLIVLGLLLKWVFCLDRGFFSLPQLNAIPAVRNVRRLFFYLPHKYRPEIRLTFFSTFLSLLAVEAGLRFMIVDLPIEWGNYLSSPYRGEGSGIYRWDAERNMYRLRPNYSRNAVMYGYSWRHNSDKRGYRNPENWDRADIVLLGDSFIYGHGVDEPSTVRAKLARLLPGKTIANLGQQGASIDYEYQILLNDGLQLSPRHVVLFFFENDLNDLIIRVTEEDMKNLLRLDTTDFTTPYFTPKTVAHQRPSLLRPFEVWLNELFIIRTYKYVSKKLGQSKNLTQAIQIEQNVDPATPKVHSEDISEGEVKDWTETPYFNNQPERQLAMRFYQRLLEKMNLLCRKQGIHLYLVTIAVPAPSVQSRLEDICGDSEIPYFDLAPFLKGVDQTANPVFLPQDGHFTDRGSEITAETILEHFPELTSQ